MGLWGRYTLRAVLPAVLLIAPGPAVLASPPDVPPPARLGFSVASPDMAADAAELTAETVVQAVLARNPSLAQMVAAWQAAAARYPQVTSLDDPMIAGIIGPASINSPDVEFAYRVEASQKFPFPGKLRLRGQGALSEAAAAGQDIEDMRLQLVESTHAALADYYLAGRALAVNAEALRLLEEFRRNAEQRFRTGLVPQQDVLQAEVEIGRQRERQLELEQVRRVAAARLNTLMHLPPSTPLLPPPTRLAPAGPLPAADVLRAAALERRPDLRALADRLAADEANLGLARKEFYPDVEVMAAYDAFWQPRERDLRPMVGMRMNLPVRLRRRHGAVAEAAARIAQRRAELARLTDQTQFQVEEAHAQATRAEKVVQLYERTILPAARANIKAAQAAYITGRLPFLSLIEAERNLIGLQDRYYEAIADFYRRRATLERVSGGPAALLARIAPGRG
ncbi:MAG: TolC family protein [Gemmataceae bacterium]|nr:TolC family protein [Gemmataceae bacterium]